MKIVTRDAKDPTPGPSPKREGRISEAVNWGRGEK
jgi:hypothetical protein